MRRISSALATTILATCLTTACTIEISDGDWPSSPSGRSDPNGSGPIPPIGGGETQDLCEDTCLFAYDGVCDDGGADAAGAACAYGSDCSDCGLRVTTLAIAVPPNPEDTTMELSESELGPEEERSFDASEAWGVTVDPSTDACEDGTSFCGGSAGGEQWTCSCRGASLPPLCRSCGCTVLSTWGGGGFLCAQCKGGDEIRAACYQTPPPEDLIDEDLANSVADPETGSGGEGGSTRDDCNFGYVANAYRDGNPCEADCARLFDACLSRVDDCQDTDQLSSCVDVVDGCLFDC